MCCFGSDQYNISGHCGMQNHAAKFQYAGPSRLVNTLYRIVESCHIFCTATEGCHCKFCWEVSRKKAITKDNEPGRLGTTTSRTAKFHCLQSLMICALLSLPADLHAGWASACLMGRLGDSRTR